MPKKSFPLDANSKLELEWGWNWKNFTVRVDGKEIGRLSNKTELESGGQWKLDDGTLLQVMLASEIGSVELRVLRDGIPLPGSGSDPETQLKSAAGIAFFIGGFNIILGLAAELGRVELLLANGLGWGSLVFGVIFIGLGLAIRKGSEIALWAAIVIFAIDGLLGIYLVVDAGGMPGTGGIVMRVFLLIAMAKASGAKKRADALKTGR